MSPPTDQEQRFTQFLYGLIQREDRAALAALRRGLGKPVGEAAEMYPYVVRFLPREAAYHDEEAYYLVASLLAWHRGCTDRTSNFGASFARLREATESESVERRFVALLNAHRDDLAEHLRHAVGLLKSRDIPVDWAQLLHDIKQWEYQRRPVQRAWASAFWAGGTEERTPEPAVTEGEAR